ATYSATNGLTAFSAYSAVTDVNAAANTDTVKFGTGFTTGGTINQGVLTRTLNGVVLSGTGLTLSSTGYDTLTLTSGGVLSTGGSNTLSPTVLALAGVEGIFHVNSGASLNVTSAITGTGGITKADG